MDLPEQRRSGYPRGLEEILKDEDRHIDGIEELQDQIEHMSPPIFLTTQVS